ncbi:MAG: PAS domain S-box protein [Verrucomicrobiota bacterium]
MKIVVFEADSGRHDALRAALAPLSDEVHLLDDFSAESDALLGADVIVLGPDASKEQPALDYVMREIPPRISRGLAVLVAMGDLSPGMRASWEESEPDDIIFGPLREEELALRLRLIIERLQDRRAMQLLERAFNNTDDGVLITKALPGGREILYANTGFEEMSGYSGAEVAGQSPNLLLGKRSDRKVAERIDNALDRGAPITEEVMLYRKDGSEFYVEAKVSPVSMSGGRATHFISVLRDISKRPDRFLYLQGREQMASNLLEKLPEGFLVTDRDGRITYVNKAMERLLGANRQGLIDGSMHQAIPEYEGSLIQRKFQEAREKDQRVTFPMQLPGSPRWLEVTVYASEDGLAATFRDISALRQSEEIFSLLKAAVDALDESIIITDGLAEPPGPRILYVNEAHCRLTGYHFAELIGQSPRIFHGPKTSREALDRIRRKMLAGLPVNSEVINYRKNGTEFYVLLNISPIRDQDGRIVNYISVQRDNTLRRREQEELMQSRKLQAVGELAGGIAHEFNNLLSPMVIQTEQLLAQHGNEPELREALLPIQQAISQSSALCRRILMLGRKDEEKKALVSLNEMITETVELLARTVDRRIEIKTVLGEGLLPLALSRVQIFQVLMNLILNARDTLLERLGHKALSSGGWEPCITISTESAKIHSPANTETTSKILPCQRIMVADNGMGMNEATRQRLFEPFFSTKDPGSGTGLGLATTWNIVQSLGGWLEVDSYVGEGSSISVYLPVSTDSFRLPEEPASDTQPMPEVDASKKSILLVDDNELLRVTMTRLLEKEGHTVTAVQDGREALDHVTENPDGYELIITDQNLPRLSGVDFITEMRRTGLRIPIILISGFLSEKTRRQLHDLGIRCILEKPIAPNDMLQAISSFGQPGANPLTVSQI